MVPGLRSREPFGGIFSFPEIQRGTIGAFDFKASRNAEPWKLPICFPPERVPSGKNMIETFSFRRMTACSKKRSGGIFFIFRYPDILA
jgi:hypothetical protein